MAPELNSWCNLQNTGFKVGDLIFVLQTLTKQKAKEGTQQGCTRIAIIG
jgi:hypothetical protein